VCPALRYSDLSARSDKSNLVTTSSDSLVPCCRHQSWHFGLRTSVRCGSNRVRRLYTVPQAWHFPSMPEKYLMTVLMWCFARRCASSAFRHGNFVGHYVQANAAAIEGPSTGTVSRSWTDSTKRTERTTSHQSFGLLLMKSIHTFAWSPGWGSIFLKAGAML